MEEGTIEGLTEGQGGKMVVVKVRETYDLHTVRNKMTVISVHTPKPDIIKKNFPGLLMQCRAYRPLQASVRIACASVLPLDPLGVGTTENDVAPEDVFNPILYKAMSNKGMSQLEARINALSTSGFTTADVSGNAADVDTDHTTSLDDEFNVYYGLLSNSHGWKHANPQSGLSMNGLKPYVYELVYNMGDSKTSGTLGAGSNNELPRFPEPTGNSVVIPVKGILGNAKPFPYLNCTSYTLTATSEAVTGGWEYPGFQEDADKPNMSANAEMDVPYLNVTVAGIVIPPSRRHELFYRMVIEWDIEFTKIRPLGEITDWLGLQRIGQSTHFINYSYSAAKEAITGSSETILENDTCMASANVDVKKVM